MSDYKITTKASWAQTMNELEFTLRKWDAKDIQVNYPRGARSEAWNQDEPARTVTLSFLKDGQRMNFTMNKQRRAVDNLRVLFICIDALRMNERRGIGELMREAYAQIAAPTSMNPYEVLKIHPDTTLDVAEAVFRTMSTKYHPDMKPEGSAERFKEINKAIEMIRKEKKA